MKEKLKTLKNNESILLLMSAEHNARLTLLEQGLDFENYDNQELLNTYTLLSIEFALTFPETSPEVIAEFASIGIEA
jgi:hypothetical protein